MQEENILIIVDPINFQRFTTFGTYLQKILCEIFSFFGFNLYAITMWYAHTYIGDWKIMKQLDKRFNQKNRPQFTMNSYAKDLNKIRYAFMQINHIP